MSTERIQQHTDESDPLNVRKSKPPPPPGPPNVTTTNHNTSSEVISSELQNNNDDDNDWQQEEYSMGFCFFITWVLPVLLLAIFSRNLADTTVPVIPVDPPSIAPRKSITKQHRTTVNKKTKSTQSNILPPSTSSSNLPDSSSVVRGMMVPTEAPQNYRDTIHEIRKRRRYIEGFSDGPSPIRTTSTDNVVETKQRKEVVKKQQSTSQGSNEIKRGISSDPTRAKMIQQINSLKTDFNNHPDDIHRGIVTADTMRLYDMQYHEGGTYEMDAIELYDKIVQLGLKRRSNALDQNQGTVNNMITVNDEVTLEYKDKSIDGLLCAIYSGQGKLYYMANMFEQAVTSYSNCIEIAPDYLDAVNARGSAYIVLGKYDEAGKDFLKVIHQDKRRIFVDSFTGISRVLEAKEDSVDGGWDSVINIIDETIQLYGNLLESNPQHRQLLYTSLNRLHHVLFTYYDSKQKDFPTAFRHLSESYKYKMSLLPPWKKGSELFKVDQSKRIFVKGFWPAGVGSETQAPIFVIGFVRSGSTLLERILDAHPGIVGTGENSVFNGRLDDIRNQIVQASISGQDGLISSLTKRLGDEVVDEMRQRWEIIDNNTARELHEVPKKPLRFVDKMLTNYYNVGFIQMLYPNALILHVIREPMDTLFSAYKHEFPGGTLDYTSDFDGLAELYIAYRDIMSHWDEALPNRVTHILYKDLVNDLPGVTKAIIKATGLPWDDSVLEFHNKKHAVNTLSSTQVRKGIYTTGLKSWMKYEKELAPLIERIGDYLHYDIVTSLKDYNPPEQCLA